MKLAFAAPPALSAAEKKISRPALVMLTAIWKIADKQIRALKTAELVEACLEAYEVFAERQLRLLRAFAVPATFALDDEKNIARPAQTALLAIHKVTATEINASFKTGNPAIESLTQFTAWCARYRTELGKSSEATTSTKAPAKNGIRTRGAGA
jgi:hypothetical protein